MTPTVLRMRIKHSAAAASQLPLSPSGEVNAVAAALLAWLSNESASPHRVQGLTFSLTPLFFVSFFLFLFFKCSCGMLVLILMDCMIVVFCMSECNAPLHTETVEFGSEERRSPIYIPPPQWIRAIVWENLWRAQSLYLFIITETVEPTPPTEWLILSTRVRKHMWPYWSQKQANWSSAEALGHCMVHRMEGGKLFPGINGSYHNCNLTKKSVALKQCSIGL